jgi:peptide/nickel transport system substrate-binding protein
VSIRSPHGRLPSQVLATAVVTAALFVTAACGSGGSKPTGASPSQSATLTVASQVAPNSLDPAQLTNGQAAYVWDSLYDTLLYTDNSGQLQPNAAQSWNYSGNGLVLTLKLRSGMTFSSGAPVNSAAVKATMARTLKTPGPEQSALAAISSITTPDDLTAVLHLSHADGSLLSSLAMGAGVIGDPATSNQSSTALNPVGSGPYTLDKSTVDGSTYVLKRRANYWNAKAYPFQTVNVRVIQSTTAAVNAMTAGEISAVSVAAQQASPFKNAAYTVTPVQATATGVLVLADRDGKVLKPLADVRVRQAINLALDRASMVKMMLMGLGKAAVQVYGPQSPAYDPTLDSTYPFDLAKAKSLMARAGYPDGFSVTLPGTVYATSFEPVITQALSAIGIKANWVPVPPQSTQSAIMSAKYPMFFAVQGIATPATDTEGYFAADGTLNPFHAQSPQLAQMLQQAGGEVDATKAAADYKAISDYAVQNALEAPFFYIGTDWVTKKGTTYLGTGSSALNSVRTFGVSG